MDTIDYATFKSRYEALATAAERVYRENPEIGNGDGRSVPSGHSFEHAYTHGYSNAKLALRQAILVLHIKMDPAGVQEQIDSLLAKPAEEQEAESSAEAVFWEPFYVTRLQLNAWLNELDEGADPAKVFASIPKSADAANPTDDLFQTSEDELKALGATAMPWPRQVLLEMIEDGPAVIGRSPADDTVAVDLTQLNYWLNRAGSGAPIDQLVQTALDNPAQDGNQLIEVPRQKLEDVLIVEGSVNKYAELEDILERYSTHYVKPATVIEADEELEIAPSAEAMPVGTHPDEDEVLSPDTLAIVRAIENLGRKFDQNFTGGKRHD